MDQFGHHLSFASTPSYYIRPRQSLGWWSVRRPSLSSTCRPACGRSSRGSSREGGRAWSGVNTVSTSLSSRNEPGNAGLHYGIKPDPQLDSFANLPHGLFRKSGDFKVLLDPAGGLRGGQEGRPALDGPGEQDLRGGLVDALGDSGDDRIVQQLRLAAMPQRGKRLQHDAILSAIVQQFPLREIRMRFDVNDSGLDPPRLEDILRLVQADIR